MNSIDKSLQILRIDASARQTDSISRALADELINKLISAHRENSTSIETRLETRVELKQRDLVATPPSFVTEDWVAANFTAEEERGPQQRKVLAESDALVKELIGADVVVISMPLYNFSIPAALKAWVDMVARPRLTFRYTDSGVEGLLKNKQVYVTYASGGVAQGSEMDHASDYMRHVLGFMGMSEVEFIVAGGTDYRIAI